MTAWAEVQATLRPDARSRDGVLPPLLLLLTVVTGLVDAPSYLKLGHVFVANMTGNVVFVGFAAAGGKGLSVSASLVAIACFVVGGLMGGRLSGREDRSRLHTLGSAVALQAVAVGAAAAVAAVAGEPQHLGRYVLIALLAFAMGLQNAVARRLAVPELTTTVLTMTLTGIAADSRLAGGTGSRIGRRGLAVAAMLAGALAGGVLALRVGVWAPLATAVALLLLVGVAARVSDTTAEAAEAP
jgi:uncharacterized membrane protein YoaK (UPF0700 family)